MYYCNCKQSKVAASKLTGYLKFKGDVNDLMHYLTIPSEICQHCGHYGKYGKRASHAKLTNYSRVSSYGKKLKPKDLMLTILGFDILTW